MDDTKKCPETPNSTAAISIKAAPIGWKYAYIYLIVS